MKTESKARSFVRSIAIGVLLSMLFFYSIHVWGSWRVESDRTDPETTGAVLLHNNCLIFDNTHTLRPNTDISKMDNNIDGTKLGGSFMNFFDGHIRDLIILSLLVGGIIFAIRNRIKKNRLSKQIQ